MIEAIVGGVLVAGMPAAALSLLYRIRRNPAEWEALPRDEQAAYAFVHIAFWYVVLGVRWWGSR